MTSALPISLLALVVSVLALVFTVLSFWWLNWKPGKVVVAGPRSFAARGSKCDLVVIQLPLVLFNRGARPVVVNNLRLSLEGCGGPLGFIAVVDRLASDQGRRYATQFPVPAYQAVSLIGEFQRHGGGLEFEAGAYRAHLEAALSNKMEWRSLARFRLSVSRGSLETINRILVAHDNWPEA